MLMIRDIVESIRDEVKDVRKYAEAALRVKMEDPALAKVYMELGQEEVKHADKLHKAAVDLIARATAGGRETPKEMRAIWDYEHKVMIEDMADARRMLDMVMQ